jgi:hypothetical protein
MTLCPIAVVAGCRKCPAVSICPLKGVIGDYKASDGQPPERSSPPHERSTAAKRNTPKR